MKTIKAGVIGASGYAGAELVRLLANHPSVELCAISSHSYEGKPLANLYPSFYQILDLAFTNEDEVITQSDVIFASMPHGHSEPLAKKAIEKGKKFIDLGADFRLDRQEDYQTWYGLDYQEPALHDQQVYGLPEFQREKIKKADLLGNPGCYPTASALGLYPLIKAQAIDLTHLIIDAKSGVTGAGKSLSETGHYPRCNESFHAYKAGAHRHTPEIEQTLSYMSKQKARITFVPHLLPVNRGILATIYADLTKVLSYDEVYALYENQYQKERFVRLLPKGDYADIKFVQYSNYCDISLHFDERNQRVIITSAIDNMVKGAAGQAIQNMNLMFDLPEELGLSMIAPSF